MGEALCVMPKRCVQNVVKLVSYGVRHSRARCGALKPVSCAARQQASREWRYRTAVRLRLRVSVGSMADCELTPAQGALARCVSCFMLRARVGARRRRAAPSLWRCRSRFEFGKRAPPRRALTRAPRAAVRAELLELTRLGGLELREEVRVERRASASEQAWGRWPSCAYRAR